MANISLLPPAVRHKSIFKTQGDDIPESSYIEPSGTRRTPNTSAPDPDPVSKGRVRGPSRSNKTYTPDGTNELRDSIIEVSRDLGISAEDLATVMSYETAGTFDPWKAGPTTQHGQHRGLIQWGARQRRQYGITQDTSVADQVRAAGRYLSDRGVTGRNTSIYHIYSAINAGNAAPRFWGRSDANNGGAPGNVREKVDNQMSGHRERARALLEQAGSRREMNLGGKLGSAGGALAGQALIPIPGVGAAVGEAVGGVYGTLVQDGITALLSKKKNKALTNAEDGSASQGAMYKKGGKLNKRSRDPRYAEGGALGGDPVPYGRKMSASEIARRVRASIEAQGTRTYSQQVRDRQILEFVDSRAPSRTTRNPRDASGTLGNSRRSLGEVNPGYAMGGKLNNRTRDPKYADGGPLDGILGKGRPRHVRLDADEIARRVRASIEAEERANPNRSYTSNRRNSESLRFTEGRARRPIDNAAGLGQYRSLGTVNPGYERTYAQGGKLAPIPGSDAKEVVGPKHEGGGVKMPGYNAEVEGGETVDGAMGGDYVFSDSIKVPNTNKTFAEVHKEMVQNGASQEEIEQLAQMQEQIAGRNGEPQANLAGGGLAGDPDPLNPLGAKGPHNLLFRDIPTNDVSFPTNNDPTSRGGILGTASSTAGKVLGKVRGVMNDPATQRDAPHLLNMARGIFGRDKTPPAARVDTSGLSRLRATSGREALASIDAGTRGAMLSNSASTTDKALAHSAGMTAKAQVGIGNIQEQAGLDMQRQSLLAGAKGQNAQFQEAYRQDKMQSDAARENMITTGVNGLREEKIYEEKVANMKQMNNVALMSYLSNLDTVAQDRLLSYLEGSDTEYATEVRKMIEGARARTASTTPTTDE